MIKNTFFLALVCPGLNKTTCFHISVSVSGSDGEGQLPCCEGLGWRLTEITVEITSAPGSDPPVCLLD